MDSAAALQKPQAARRCLFGAITTEHRIKMGEMMAESLAVEAQRGRDRFNYDFINDKPVTPIDNDRSPTGGFRWELSANPPSVFVDPTTDTQTALLEGEQVSPMQQVPSIWPVSSSPCRQSRSSAEETAELPRAAKRKRQTTLSDYFACTPSTSTGAAGDHLAKPRDFSNDSSGSDAASTAEDRSQF